REGFFRMAKQFPHARFVWLDIEDDAEQVGEREVENFPTLLIEKEGVELFYGALPPQHEHLRRLIESFQQRS
ncbi:MAG: thioredoxin family protein, partial [Burkholderiales bacterium]